MVEGKKKSRSKRRVYVKTPGGKTKLHYRNRKPSKAQCSNCGAVLPGVPRVNARALRSLPKSKRRPERPYGGKLCSRCMRQVIIAQSRK